MEQPRDTPAGAPSETSALELLAFGLLTLAIIAQSQIFANYRTDTVDDELFAYFGWLISHGGTLYLDMWDNKPPGIFWVNALGMWLGNGDLLGVALVTLAAVLILHVLFFMAAAGFVPRGAAALGTCLASLYLCHSFFAGATNRTETYVMLFELAAIAVYLRALARPRGWKWLLVGVFCGTALVFKQIGFAALGATILHQIVLATTRRSTWRASGERIATIATGALLVGAAVSLALLARGSLKQAAFAIYGFNRAYFAVSDSTLLFNYANYLTLERHALPILTLPLLLAAAAMIHAPLAWKFPQYRLAAAPGRENSDKPTCPFPLWLFVFWMLIAMYGAMLGPHGWRHYWLPVLPPLLLLGVYTINLVKGEMRLLPRVVQRGTALVALLAIGYFASTAVSRQWDAIARIWIDRDPVWRAGSWRPTVKPSKIELVAEKVRELSDPGDRILCWNYYPGVYLYSRRRALGRFPTLEKTWQVGDENTKFMLDETGRALAHSPPKLIILDWRDYHRLTATGDVHYRNRLEPWLARMISGGYELAALTDEFYVLQRHAPANHKPKKH